MDRSDVAPAACSSAITGIRSAARFPMAAMAALRIRSAPRRRAERNPSSRDPGHRSLPELLA